MLAESFERIHRSNLVGMGVLPLQFPPGQDASSLGLTGLEVITIGVVDALDTAHLLRTITVTADDVKFEMLVRLDTSREVDYYRHGGILPYTLRGALPHQQADDEG